MKKLNLFVCIITVLFHIDTVQAQWTVYDCSVLPYEADTKWFESSGTLVDGVTEILSVIDDPDIQGNKLIRVDGNQLNFREMWRCDWDANPDIGTTILFRVKALDTTTYDCDFDFYIKDGKTRERLQSKKGKILNLLMSGISLPVNTTEWHIFRVTIGNGLVDVYLDEDLNSHFSGTGQSISANFFLFGDGIEWCSVGSLYDWIIWDVSGAYPPGQGTPLPDTLAGSVTAVLENGHFQPEDFTLYQNYPNPFNPSTAIRFNLGFPSHTSLKIYDITGKLVHTLVNETIEAGSHSFIWDGRDAEGNGLPSGVYIYSLQSDHFTKTNKMTLIR